MKAIVITNYLLCLLPVFSLTEFFVGFYFSSRFLILPFFALFFFKRDFFFVDKSTAAFCVFLPFFTFYAIYSIFDERQTIIYFGYFVAFSYHLLFSLSVKHYPNLFLCFFRFFFVINAIYSLFQLFLLNTDLKSYSMFHSNLPAQKNYIPHTFIQEPFYRYTGLFNESSPYAFYLVISYVFFSALGYKNYKFLTFFLLVFSGSKLALLFILLHFSFFSKLKIFKVLSSVFLSLFLVVFFRYYELLSSITSGQMASMNHRLNSLLDSLNFSFLGVDLGKTSEGDIALNFFSIFTTGFGLLGLGFAFLILFCFFYFSKSQDKKLFLIPFLLGLLASGSLMIFQYSLIFGCIAFLSFFKSKNIMSEKSTQTTQ